MVALHKGHAVGFRAYFATKWTAGKENRTFIMLNPGDTVVHPDHRNMGLSLEMGLRAIEEYDSRFQIFLNSSSSVNAVPGYRKMGFLPLAPKFPVILYGKEKSAKDYLPSKLRKSIKRSRMYTLIRSLPGEKRKVVASQTGTGSQRCGDIVMAEEPKPDEMFNLMINKNQPKINKIKIYQDEVFYRWRFLNNRKKYSFFYHQEGGEITGYLVLEVSALDARHGKIVDYADRSGRALECILEYIVRSAAFSKLSIISYGLEEDLLRILQRLDIGRYGSRREAWESQDAELHLLVRPVKKTLSEEDWFVAGLDMRNFENWEVKPICDDGA